MHYWLIKGDPDDYSAADLERDGQTVWDGVSNPVALKHLRSMAAGDGVFIYHTGSQKAIVAIGEVAVGPRSDPKDKSGKAVLVEMRFKQWLKNPVTLAEIKANPDFADFELVRIGRLSVMPVSAGRWKAILALTGGVR